MPTPRLIHVNQIDKDSIEKAFDLNKRTEKIITFIYPSITEGAIGSFYKFPFNGEVKRIDAYCADSSVVDTIFTVEKVSEKDFKAYTKMTEGTLSNPVDKTETDETKQKVTSDKMKMKLFVSPWRTILSKDVIIPKEQNFQDDTYSIQDKIVKENDLFRIDFKSCTPKDLSLLSKMAYNLTIQIVIQTDDNY